MSLKKGLCLQEDTNDTREKQIDLSKCIFSLLVPLLSVTAAETEMSQERNRTTTKKGKAERSGLGRRGNGKAAVGRRILKQNRTDCSFPPSVP